MGSDDLFKKRTREKIKRKENNRIMAPSRYLIVCEGEKTEPNYFEGIKKRINREYSGNKISVATKVELNIHGTGRNTNDLVEFVKEMINKSPLGYGHVWIIYDKDDFSDDQFNSSIEQAESYGYNVGWSNEAIELWFVLHFEYLNSGIKRGKYCDKLTEYFESLGLGKYEKNRTDIFEVLGKYGEVQKAIGWAKKLIKVHDEACVSSPAKMLPATKVYKLVEELLEYIK
ncbi:MAG: RloB family protein [Clostridia bacterium]|nr:RloB family protein [Clostridia bacterium]